MTDERASPVVLRERPRSATRAPSAPGPLVAESSAGSLRAANPNPNPRVLVVPAFREASYQERRGWEAAWQKVRKACEDMLGSLGEAVQVKIAVAFMCPAPLQTHADSVFRKSENCLQAYTLLTAFTFHLEVVK